MVDKKIDVSKVKLVRSIVSTWFSYGMSEAQQETEFKYRNGYYIVDDKNELVAYTHFGDIEFGLKSFDDIIEDFLNNG